MSPDVPKEGEPILRGLFYDLHCSQKADWVVITVQVGRYINFVTNKIHQMINLHINEI